MKAVISMTTIPNRIEHIEPCVDSLLAQGLPVYVWAQETTERTGAVLKRVPAFLYDKPGLTVTVVEERGPICKLIPALEAGHELVITADDDHTYGPRWAAGLLKGIKKYPDTAICYRGRILREGKAYHKSGVITRTRRVVNFITSVSGVIYHRRFFDDSIFEEWREWFMNDDIVVAAHLKRRGVPMMVVPLPKGCRIERLDCMHIDPLYAVNVKKRLNDKGLEKVFW